MNASTALDVPEDFMPQHTDVQLRLERPLDMVQLELDNLHYADKAAEKTKARIKPWLWVTGIGSFLGLMLVFPLVLLIPFCILLYLYFKANNKDVEDRRLDVARHLLDTLKGEIKTGTQVILEMDFRRYDQANAPPKGAFSQQWLRMALVLRNGAALQVSAVTHCKRKSRRKRKYTKHKDKLREALTLDIRPAKGASFNPAQSQRIAQALAKPLPQAQLRRCQLKPKTAQVSFMTAEAVHMSPAGRFANPFTNRQALLDAHKVLTLTTMGFRAVSQSNATTA